MIKYKIHILPIFWGFLPTIFNTNYLTEHSYQLLSSRQERIVRWSDSCVPSVSILCCVLRWVEWEFCFALTTFPLYRDFITGNTHSLKSLFRHLGINSGLIWSASQCTGTAPKLYIHTCSFSWRLAETTNGPIKTSYYIWVTFISTSLVFSLSKC